MTTIAYKDGTISVDSRMTRGDTILDDNYNKIHTVDGVRFIICGTVSDLESLIAAYFGAEVLDTIALAAIIVQDNRVYDFQVQEGKVYKLDITGQVWAVGSGEDHAFTAMDLGASTKQAIKLAAKRDVNTGGKIRTIQVGI